MGAKHGVAVHRHGVETHRDRLDGLLCAGFGVIVDRAALFCTGGSQLGLADAHRAVVGHGVAHGGVAHKVHRRQAEVARFVGNGGDHAGGDHRVLGGHQLVGRHAGGQIHHLGIGAAAECVERVGRGAGVDAQLHHVVRREHAGHQIEGAAGIRAGVLRAGPHGHVGGIHGLGPKLKDLVGAHLGCHAVVPGGAVEPLVLGCKQALGGLEVIQILLLDLHDNLVFGVGEGGLNAVVAAGFGLILRAAAQLQHAHAVGIGLDARVDGLAVALAVEVIAEAVAGQAGKHTRIGQAGAQLEHVAHVEAVGAGGQLDFAVRPLAEELRRFLAGEEGHIVDLDLLVLLECVSFVPHGIQAHPVHRAAPVGLGQMNALISVGGADVLIRQVDQIGVPLAVRGQIHMHAGCAGQISTACVTIQLDGSGRAQVFGADLDPGNTLHAVGAKINGHIGVAAGAAVDKGIIVVALRVALTLPGDLMPGIAAHAAIHILVLVEIPQNRRRHRCGGIKLAILVFLDADLSIDVLKHRADSQLTLLGGLVLGGATGTLDPFKEASAAQLIDDGLGQNCNQGLGRPVAADQAIGAAITLDRVDAHKAGVSLAHGLGDGEVLSTPNGAVVHL